MKYVVGLAFLLIAPVTASATIVAGSSFSYEGRAFDSSGNPLVANVKFKISIRPPGVAYANCVMYSETQTQDLAGSNGFFTLAINSSSTQTQSFGGGLSSINAVFANAGSVPLSTSDCGGSVSPYSPSASDGRNLVVSISTDNGATYEDLPAVAMGAVPYAVEAQQIAGFKPSQLLRTDAGVSGTTQFTQAMLTELNALIGGSSTQYAKISPTAGTVVSTYSGSPSTPVEGSMWYDSSAGGLKVYQGGMTRNVGGVGSGTVTSINTGTGLTGGPVTTTGTISIMAGGVGTNELASLAVTSAKIQDASITNLKIADNTIKAQKMSTSFSPGNVLTTDGSGNLTWSNPPSGAPTGAAGGDLTSNYPNPNVASVGTSSAVLIHNAELAANAATPVNTNNIIVRRDGAGDFAAGVATLNGLALKNAGSVVNVVNPVGAAYTLTLPMNAGATGQVLANTGAGVTTWANPVNFADGATPMTAALRHVDGLQNAPGMSFTLETSTGFYRPTANSIGLSVAGTPRMTVNSNQVTFADGGGAGQGSVGIGFAPANPGASNATAANISLSPSYNGSSGVATYGAQISNSLTFNAPSSTVANQNGIGVSSVVANPAGGASVSEQAGITISHGATGPGGTITNSYGVYNKPVIGTSGSVINSLFGIFLDSPNATGGSVTTRYGVYQNDALAKNQFKGPVIAAGTVGATSVDPLSASMNDTNVYVPSGSSANQAWSAGAAAAISVSNSSSTVGSASYFGMTARNVSSVQRAYLATISSAGNSPIVALGASTSATTYAERLRIDSTGNVGIGTTAPAEKFEVAGNLKVRGQAYSSIFTLSSGASIDFNNGNVQILQSIGGNVITLSNMKDGARYTLIFEDTTQRTYTFSGCTPMSNTAIGPTTALTRSIFNITYANSICYIDWKTGYN